MALDSFVQIYPEDRGWRKIVDKCFLHAFKKLNVYCGFFVKPFVALAEFFVSRMVGETLLMSVRR